MIACMLLVVVSCDSLDNYGYPWKVSFGREGGTRIVTGEQSFYTLAIRDYDGKGKEQSWGWPNGPEDTLVVAYQWLTIKALPYQQKMILIAEPNNGRKGRTLYVTAAVDNFDAEIKVTQ